MMNQAKATHNAYIAACGILVGPLTALAIAVVVQLAHAQPTLSPSAFLARSEKALFTSCLRFSTVSTLTPRAAMSVRMVANAKLDWWVHVVADSQPNKYVKKKAFNKSSWPHANTKCTDSIIVALVTKSSWLVILNMSSLNDVSPSSSSASSKSAVQARFRLASTMMSRTIKVVMTQKYTDSIMNTSKGSSTVIADCQCLHTAFHAKPTDKPKCPGKTRILAQIVSPSPFSLMACALRL
mmetsp:Transcript_76499/g.234120  ORF Transcript_76499/g.234120 Transcript_76499/m.234120 type:complete len:239 (-) Transcript_76499:702-1418(-)